MRVFLCVTTLFTCSKRLSSLLLSFHVYVDATMSAPGQAKPAENPALTGQRPTESSGDGDHGNGGGNGPAGSEQNRRRHPPEVYAALQQLLFEGQLRLVIADDTVSTLCLPLIARARFRCWSSPCYTLANPLPYRAPFRSCPPVPPCVPCCPARNGGPA